MTRLSQIIAIEKGTTTRVEKAFTEAYKTIQKQALLNGITRMYQPRDADGENLPGESTKVQVTIEGVLDNVNDFLTRWFDVAATKEWANTDATADVVVDGNVLLANVPVTYTLFLERRLEDLRTFILKLPTLDLAEDWSEGLDPGVWVTSETKTTRSKKIPRNHQKAPATDKHAAQVEIYFEDVVVGDWSTKKFSGALPPRRLAQLVARIERLQQAVKYAREEANTHEIEDAKVAHKVLGYVFAE